MGLGKTIEILSLVDSRRAKHSNGENIPDGKVENGATLIICPLNVLGQWRKEAVAAFGSSDVVEVFYGASRNQKLLDNDPLVV